MKTKIAIDKDVESQKSKKLKKSKNHYSEIESEVDFNRFALKKLIKRILNEKDKRMLCDSFSREELMRWVLVLNKKNKKRHDFEFKFLNTEYIKLLNRDVLLELVFFLSDHKVSPKKTKPDERFKHVLFRCLEMHSKTSSDKEKLNLARGALLILLELMAMYGTFRDVISMDSLSLLTKFFFVEEKV